MVDHRSLSPIGQSVDVNSGEALFSERAALSTKLTNRADHDGYSRFRCRALTGMGENEKGGSTARAKALSNADGVLKCCAERRLPCPLSTSQRGSQFLRDDGSFHGPRQSVRR